jgi:hypothetical protein
MHLVLLTIAQSRLYDSGLKRVENISQISQSIKFTSLIISSGRTAVCAVIPLSTTRVAIPPKRANKAVLPPFHWVFDVLQAHQENKHVGKSKSRGGDSLQYLHSSILRLEISCQCPHWGGAFVIASISQAEYRLSRFMTT